MAVRPSQHWREGVEQDEREIAAGTLDPEEKPMAELFPESLLTRTDEVLATFEAEVATLEIRRTSKCSPLSEMSYSP